MIKPIEYVYINKYEYLEDQGTDDMWWGNNRILGVEQEQVDKPEWQRVFFSLPRDQSELLVCKFLGFKPKEIVKLLGYKNIGKYYATNFKLKQSYRKIKSVE